MTKCRGRPGLRKRKGSFQIPIGRKSSLHKRLWSHGSNLKLKGEIRTLYSLTYSRIKYLCSGLIINECQCGHDVLNHIILKKLSQQNQKETAIHTAHQRLLKSKCITTVSCQLENISVTKSNVLKWSMVKKAGGEVPCFCLQQILDTDKCPGMWKRRVFLTRYTRNRESLVSIKAGRQTGHLFWLQHKAKYIRTGKIGRIWFCFGAWAGDRAIWPCESDRRSQTVYAKQKETGNRKGCHKGVGRNERRREGQVGIVSQVPLSIHRL